MIREYIIPFDESGVVMPSGAKLLHVAAQGVDICVWALVDPDAPLVRRELLIVPTGCAPPVSAEYVGTGMLYGGQGRFVGHVFEAAA